jgi:hypothetical protein
MCTARSYCGKPASIAARNANAPVRRLVGAFRPARHRRFAGRLGALGGGELGCPGSTALDTASAAELYCGLVFRLGRVSRWIFHTPNNGLPRRPVQSGRVNGRATDERDGLLQLWGGPARAAGGGVVVNALGVQELAQFVREACV